MRRGPPGARRPPRAAHARRPMTATEAGEALGESRPTRRSTCARWPSSASSKRRPAAPAGTPRQRSVSAHSFEVEGDEVTVAAAGSLADHFSRRLFERRRERERPGRRSPRSGAYAEISYDTVTYLTSAELDAVGGRSARSSIAIGCASPIGRPAPPMPGRWPSPRWLPAAGDEQGQTRRPRRRRPRIRRRRTPSTTASTRVSPRC